MSNRYMSAAILFISLLHFCEGFIFVICLMVFRVHTVETLENVTNSERPYSGVNFAIQLLSHFPSKMDICEANVTFAGDFKQK